MAEPLLASTGIKLFGQLVEGLSIDWEKAGKNVGPLKRLADKLKVGDPQLARIYGFSHDGAYYDLTRPAIFLVDNSSATPVANELPKIGVASMPPELVNDMTAWDLDQDDFSLRIDLDIGPLDRILLDAELGTDAMGYAGASVRLQQGGASAKLQQAGASARLRYAGASAKLQGGRGGGLGD